MALSEQMIRASRLDIALYEEVERDLNQTSNAVTVVVITAVAAGISGLISGAMRGAGAGVLIGGLIGGIIAALIGWLLWSGIVYVVGTTLFRGTATWGEVLRTVGFAQSPNVLRIFGFIPILGGLITLVAGIWTIVTTIIAVRQSLDIGTGAAIVTAVIGGIVYFLVFLVIGAVLGLGGLLMGAVS
ncbi:MAG TPA: YIP1 family protein [Chloroflexota bacterium]|nr:YIP1 family protein [Chloroflexota bacterium]